MSKKIILTNRENLSTNLFFDDIRKTNVISKDIENDLFDKYHLSVDVSERKKIKDYIITSNLKWCVSLSKTFRCGSMQPSDLISVAYEGMINCFDLFDHTKGMKFATFASFHMKNKLNNFIYSEGKTINDITSNKIIDKLILKVTHELETELNRTATSSEIIEKFNSIKPDNVAELTQNVLFGRSISKFELASLDAPFSNNENDDNSTIETKTDFGSKYADHDLLDIEKSNTIKNSLKRILSERECEIVLMTYGLYDGYEYTAEMISSKLSLTRARIGQILTTAINKLQDNKQILISLLS